MRRLHKSKLTHAALSVLLLTILPVSSVRGASLKDDDARTLMYTLSDLSSQTNEAVQTVLTANDTRFVAVFLELIRANQIGLVRGVDSKVYIDTLEKLSGKMFGNDWPAWVEWTVRPD